MRRLTFSLRLDRGAFRLAADCDADLSGVTALFGPSGSGKTTILRALAGFEPDARGRVVYDGEAWLEAGRSLPPHRRPVGYVFQDGRLFPHLNVLGNLRFAARRAPSSGPDIRLAAVVEAMELGALLPRSVSGLSGGEAQRVAIARALLARPSLLLMDEPLSALDRRRKAAILPLIADLPARFGVPVLYVTHSVEEIARIADRAISVAGGEVLGEGPAAEMIGAADPTLTGRFEAGVVLEGRVAVQDAEYALTGVAVGDEGALIWTPAIDAPVGSETRLRVRARDVTLAIRKPVGLSTRNILPARITAIAPEAGAYAEIDLVMGDVPLKARVTRQAVAALALAPGDSVWAAVKAAAFDRRLMRLG